MRPTLYTIFSLDTQNSSGAGPDRNSAGLSFKEVMRKRFGIIRAFLSVKESSNPRRSRELLRIPPNPQCRPNVCFDSCGGRPARDHVFSSSSSHVIFFD